MEGGGDWPASQRSTSSVLENFGTLDNPCVPLLMHAASSAPIFAYNLRDVETNANA
jgi:hypothetical protein